jgi:DNA polymerase III alpha subunit (gram-positive type)
MRALIIDTETTDLISNHSIKLEKQPHMIEYFGRHLDLASGEVLGEYETLIKPPIQINATTTRITGITNEMLKDAPPISGVVEFIAENINTTAVVIAHNMSFDAEMINFEFERCSVNGFKWPRQICTVEATLHIKGFRLNLQALHEHLFGERFKDHHRARPDVDALSRICVELFKRGEL